MVSKNLRFGMLNKLIYIFKYIKYFLTAQTRHDLHSPFVYELTTDVILSETYFYAYDKVEEIRSKLLDSSKVIVVEDLGAGSTAFQLNKNRRVKDIVRVSSKDAKYGQLLFRLANHFNPETIVELGTCAGLSTLYLANGCQTSTVYSIEGAPELAKLAAKNFKKIKQKNIIQLVGNFDVELNPLLATLEKVDFVFIDGNHRKLPTLQYFEQFLSKSHNNTVFIFDDIHWSNEMEEAWQTIKSDARVSVTIDLFVFGIVFLRQELSKQHFIIRF